MIPKVANVMKTYYRGITAIQHLLLY